MPADEPKELRRLMLLQDPDRLGDAGTVEPAPWSAAPDDLAAADRVRAEELVRALMSEPEQGLPPDRPAPLADEPAADPSELGGQGSTTGEAGRVHAQAERRIALSRRTAERQILEAWDQVSVDVRDVIEEAERDARAVSGAAAEKLLDADQVMASAQRVLADAEAQASEVRRAALAEAGEVLRSATADAALVRRGALEELRVVIEDAAARLGLEPPTPSEAPSAEPAGDDRPGAPPSGEPAGADVLQFVEPEAEAPSAVPEVDEAAARQIEARAGAPDGDVGPTEDSELAALLRAGGDVGLGPLADAHARSVDRWIAVGGPYPSPETSDDVLADAASRYRAGAGPDHGIRLFLLGLTAERMGARPDPSVALARKWLHRMDGVTLELVWHGFVERDDDLDPAAEDAVAELRSELREAGLPALKGRRLRLLVCQAALGRAGSSYLRPPLRVRRAELVSRAKRSPVHFALRAVAAVGLVVLTVGAVVVIAGLVLATVGAI